MGACDCAICCLPLAPHYDLLLIDTQGARSVLLEMAVLASDLALSPVTPEILAARELRRGTLQLIEDIAPYRHLGIEPPPLHLLINRVHPVSSNARLVQQALRQVFQETGRRARAGHRRAGHRSLSARRDARIAGASVEYRQPAGARPAALETMRTLAGELFPHGRTASRWSPAGPMREGRPWRARMNWRAAATAARPDRVRAGRRLARGAHVRRAPEIHEARLRADLHQRDGERPPRRPQRPRAASPRRPAGGRRIGEPWLT